MTGHHGVQRIRGYEAWVQCECGWETAHYASGADAWYAHQVHVDQATGVDSD